MKHACWNIGLLALAVMTSACGSEPPTAADASGNATMLNDAETMIEDVPADGLAAPENMAIEGESMDHPAMGTEAANDL